MIKLYHKLALISTAYIIFSGALYGQGATPPPFVVPQYLNNQGLPNAGGFLYSYVAGTSTPQSTYTDATGSVANPNPTILDANGRAQIWLKPAIGYKLVLADSSNVILWSADDVVTLVPSTGVWTTSGNNIFNNNSGFVGIGCNSTSTVARLDVCGISSGANYLVRIDDVSSSPGINFYGNSIKLGSIAGDSSASFRVRAGNDASQLAVTNGMTTFQNQSASGTTEVVIEAGAGNAPADHVFSIQSTTPTELAFIQANGEMAAPLFNGTGVGGADCGGGYPCTFQNDNSKFLVDLNGDVTLSGALAIASISGSTQCLQVNSSGIVSGTGSACGSGGGGGGSPGGPANAIQFNNTTFGGSSNLLWSNTAQQMNIAGLSGGLTVYVSNGYVQSTGGFDACPSSSACTTATPYTQIQAPTGGVYANSLKAIKYIQTGNSSGVPTPTTSDTFGAGSLYWDTGSTCEEVYDGSSWSCLAAGGATSPGGSNTDVQYNGSGSFAGAGGGKFAYSSSAQQLNLIGTANTALALYVTSGFVQSTGGFDACAPSSGSCSTATPYTQIQAPGGGVYAKSLKAINYTQTGNSNGVPTVTTSDTFGAGAVYYDTGAGCEELYSGSAWACLGTGGSGITSITATSSASGPGLTFSNTTNQVTVANSGNTFTFSLPQQIGTSSTPTFGGVTAQTFTSTATGSTKAFQVPSGGGSAYIDGNGNGFFNSQIQANAGFGVSSGIVINSSGNWVGGTIVSPSVTATNFNQSGGGSYQVGGSAVINSSAQFVGSGGINTSGTITTLGNLNVGVSGSSAVVVGGNLEVSAGITNGTLVVNRPFGTAFGIDRNSSTGGTLVIGSCTLSFAGGLLFNVSGC